MAGVDVLIVGGGIGGASLGAELAAQCSVLLVEAESQCGVHATGRSAAFWLETYGGPIVSQLSAASRGFLAEPPGDFSEQGFLTTRGAIHVARSEAELPELVSASALGRDELEALVPGIRREWTCALFEPSCSDIDVAGLHSAYLRRLRRSGGEVRTDSALASAQHQGSCWRASLRDGTEVEADVIVDAAGAWADPVARACGLEPLGIQPKLRTMVQLRVGRAGMKGMPLVIDASEQFYFKGEGDRTIWLSPHDEIDSDPCDAAPEEIDVAVAIDRFEKVVDWGIEAVERRWAGLRSFSPDRNPVYGFDPEAPAFFWCAGQGGFGIQTAPAAAKMAAAILLGQVLEPMVADIDPAPFEPARFR
ncbi:MAG: NAD(P)/FAD-dependent oxidoreductase [Sphingomicrobium sp.]